MYVVLRAVSLHVCEKGREKKRSRISSHSSCVCSQQLAGYFVLACLKLQLLARWFYILPLCANLMLLFSLSTLVTKQKYSAVSLCNISTEVLKVINATEELIAESTDPCDFPADVQDRGRGTFPLGTDPVRLDEQLTTLEENVRTRISMSKCHVCE